MTDDPGSFPPKPEGSSESESEVGLSPVTPTSEAPYRPSRLKSEIRRSDMAQTAIALGGALFLVIAAFSFAFAVWMLFSQVTKDLQKQALAPIAPNPSPTSSQKLQPTPSSFTRSSELVLQSIAQTDAAPSAGSGNEIAKAKMERDYEMQEELLLRFSGYVPPVLAFGIGLTSAFVGYTLLRAAGSAPREIIPPQDYQLLSEMLRSGNDNAINNYVKLGSLTGAIGAFTKLGITGLPLATIGLTILFALLGLVVGGQNTFYDLAKLTLGITHRSSPTRGFDRLDAGVSNSCPLAKTS